MTGKPSVLRWRAEAEGFPPSTITIASPYDLDVHYAKKRTTTWIGYKVHLTKTCEVGQPPLITNVGTTTAPVADRAVLADVHGALKSKDLRPQRHLVDAGSIDADQLVARARDHAITLVGPPPADNQWQTRTEGTLSKAIRVNGLRQSRYIGSAKTHLQHLLLAVAAINLRRIADWIAETPLAPTRQSRPCPPYDRTRLKPAFASSIQTGAIPTCLGRVMRDIGRKTKGKPDLEAAFARKVMLAGRVDMQNKTLRPVRGQPAGTDMRVFSLHAPEVECIGKGKAHKPYEFGVKVSVATTLHRSKGGQFVTHLQALPGKPYDGHTLESVIPAIEAQVGATLTRSITDAGTKGHNAPETRRFKVYTAGQKRGMPDAIKRVMRRRAAVEPVIGHLKDDHRRDRSHLAAVGYNFRRLPTWLRPFITAFWIALTTTNQQIHANRGA